MDAIGPYVETQNFAPAQILTFKDVVMGDRIAGDIVEHSNRLVSSQNTGRWEITTRGGLVIRGVADSLIEVEKKI